VNEATPPEAAYHFKGQVLGPDLEPVPGAIIKLVASPKQERGGVGMLERMMRRGGWGNRREAGKDKPVFHEAVADSEGRFDVALPGKGPFNLRVEAEGLAPTVVERVRPSSAENPVYLKAGSVLSGTIYDLRGRNPVEGASVVARPMVDHGFNDPDDPERFCRTTQSAKDGSFVLEGLAANFYDLEIRSPGHALGYVPRVAAEPVRTETVLAYLEPGFRVAGRVVDRDSPPSPRSRRSVGGRTTRAASS
jgi:hypothetical protein